MRAYLDHAATSPMPESVLAAYLDALRGVGNPASTHGHGQAARERLEAAREQIASLLGADPAETILNTGGTESINLALKGIYWARRRAGIGGESAPVLLIAEGEHHATIGAAEWLCEEQGARMRRLPLDADGVLRPDVLAEALAEEGPGNVALVSFIWANNEVGSVQPVAELCGLARDAGVPVHVDAVAALGRAPIDLHASGASAISVSAHKIGGPVGVGALLLRRDAAIDPLFHGGEQQRSRSGTQNIAGAVAFAAALSRCAGPEHEARLVRLAALQDRLIAGVRETVPDAVLRGADPRTPGARVPGNAHFTFPGCQGDSLVFLLDAAGISTSVGSACQAGVMETSHVLLAMGIPEAEARGALRITLGFETREDEVEAFLDALPGAVERARAAGLV
ncbi:IscS-like cysteine desulfurase [Leucobacter soli]|uniref:IscS-like cysteine desulfurase n=2 Tax=Leucobacter soli TaxID=2812850 RepID=A0A916NMB7_9MICO|nr:cysteine desulfurase family protein [Leucobacter soli]CAG7601668.1 IscS-like cysteine desulfurase [Leucobacter soli]